MSTVIFYGQFTASKVGKTGLTPTIDVKRITRADGTVLASVTGGSAVEVWRGVYLYVLAGADLTLYDYVAVFITADSTVDAKEVSALWSRFSEADHSPSAGFIASAVLDAVASGYNTAGSIGHFINSAGAAADPLLNSVPGAYIQPSAGWVLGQLLAKAIVYSGPINPITGNVSLTISDDYYSADGRALTYSVPNAGGIPSLVGATVIAHFYSQSSNTSVLDVAFTVANAGTANQSISLELSSANTAVFSAGTYKLAAVATLSNGHVDTLLQQTVYVTGPKG